MKIHSITQSLHGEPPLTGHPCTILRLAGCNLQCGYCDTDFTFKYTDYGSSVRKEINAHSLLITGGEPLLQSEEVLDLVQDLVKTTTVSVVIETNGTKDITPFIGKANIVADYKMDIRGYKFHESCFNADYIKCVFNPQTIVSYKHLIENYWHTKAVIILSPQWFLWETKAPLLKEVAAYVTNYSGPLRLMFSIQLHKLLNIA